MEDLKNNSVYITLDSVYIPENDITIIIEDTYINGVPHKTEIKGFYYGTPSLENTNIFKEKGVVCFYD